MNKKKQKVNKINMLLSILVAFAAWMYVVYNVHPSINKTFRDVPVEFTGQYELAEKGYAVNTAELTGMDVSLKINRTDVAKIAADDITIQADVANAVEGSNNIQLNVKVPRGTDIRKLETNIITVDVQPVINKDVTVIARYASVVSDSSPEDTGEPIISKTDYEKVSVYGTADNLKKVKYAAVQFAIGELDSAGKDFIVSPVAVRANGETVPFITVFPSEIAVTAYHGNLKKVRLSMLVKDEKTDDVRREYTAPSEVYIKGLHKTLNTINEISTDEININGITTSKTIPLTYNLPAGVYISNESLNQNIFIKAEKK